MNTLCGTPKGLSLRLAQWGLSRPTGVDPATVREAEDLHPCKEMWLETAFGKLAGRLAVDLHEGRIFKASFEQTVSVLWTYRIENLLLFTPLPR